MKKCVFFDLHTDQHWNRVIVEICVFLFVINTLSYEYMYVNFLANPSAYDSQNSYLRWPYFGVRDKAENPPLPVCKPMRGSRYTVNHSDQ